MISNNKSMKIILQKWRPDMKNKIKKLEHYTRCANCKRVFCNEHYDMGRYAYTTCVSGKKLYFCGFNCMIKFEREHKPHKLKGENVKC